MSKRERRNSISSAGSDGDDEGGGKPKALSTEELNDAKLAMQLADDGNPMLEENSHHDINNHYPLTSSAVASIATSATTLPISDRITPRRVRTKPSIVTTTKKAKSPFAFFVLDIESQVDDSNDGPNPKEDRVVQIYIENMETGASTGKVLVQPPCFKSLSNTSAAIMVPPDVGERVAKISALNDGIRGASEWPTVLKDIIKFVKEDGKGRQVVFVAWNGNLYDFPLMEYESIRHHLDTKLSSFVHYYLDAMVFVRDHPTFWMNEQMPDNWKLTTVHGQLIPSSHYNAHDAKNDTKAMKECLLRILGNNSGDWSTSVQEFLLPANCEDMNLETIEDPKLREAVEDSLLRERLFHYTHPVLKDQARCKKIIKDLPARKLIQGKDTRLSERARRMGCIEIEPGSKAYPTLKIDGKRVYLHLVACTALNGLRKIVDFDAHHLFETGSHDCDNENCINGMHQTWESLKINMSRKGCYGYCRLVDENLDKLVKTIECKHNPRCRTFVTVRKDSVSENDWNDIVSRLS